MSDAASPPMSSHRPYLLRALNEWITDNGMTPHLLVDAKATGVQVPAQAVHEGRVVLNIAARAVAQLRIDNDAVSFTARFGGVSHPVMVPVNAVLAIYARETGQGMALPDDALAQGDKEHDVDPAEDADSAPPAPLSAVPSSPATTGDEEDGGGDGPASPSPRRAGHLRIVK